MSRSKPMASRSEGSDVEKLPRCGKPGYVVLVRHMSHSKDEYALFDHSDRNVGAVSEASGYGHLKVSYLDTKQAKEMANKTWDMAMIEKRGVEAIKLSMELVRCSGRLYYSKVEAIKYANDLFGLHLHADSLYPTSSFADVIVCSAEGHDWELPNAASSPGTRWHGSLVGQINVLEHVFTVESYTNPLWLPYPEISPEEKSSYFVTKESNGYRYTAHDSIMWCGDKFLVNDEMIVAWMAMPSPYNKDKKR